MYSKLYKMNEMETQEKWLELVETTQFEDLTPAEIQFVEANGGESKFRLDQRAVNSAKDVYFIPEPRNLELNEKKGIVVPLYQTLLAVAAAVVISFFVFRMNDTVILKMENPIARAQADTVYVEKATIDTVIQSETQVVTRYIKIPEECPTPTVFATQSSVVKSQPNFNPDFSSITLSNSGRPASKDETFNLVENWTLPN